MIRGENIEIWFTLPHQRRLTDSKVSVQEYVYKFMTLGYDGFMISDHNS